MRKVSGNFSVPYFLGTSREGSSRIDIEVPLGKSFLTVSQSSSTLTVRTTRRSPAWLVRVSSEGSSSRQGGHQVAQKFSSTGCPRRLRSDHFLPLTSGSSKSGAS